VNPPLFFAIVDGLKILWQEIPEPCIFGYQLLIGLFQAEIISPVIVLFVKSAGEFIGRRGKNN